MNLQILPNEISSKNKRKNVSFQMRQTFDIGASDPRGTLKIRVQKDNGEDLFEYKGFLSEHGFKDNDDFTRRVATSTDVEALIAKDIESIESQLKDTNPKTCPVAIEKLTKKLNELKASREKLVNLPKSERQLTGFALLVPGTLKERTVLFMANLKDLAGAPLQNVNLEQVLKEIEKQGKVELAGDLRFLPCKDLAGTGIGIAKKVINHPVYGKRFGPGFSFVVVQTGGGFGAVNVLVEDEKAKFVSIKTDESGHDRVYSRKTGKEERLGKIGASTSTVIENYSRELGITDPAELKALVATGKAEIATLQKVSLSTLKDSEAIKALLKTQVYKIVSQNSEATTLQVQDLKRFAQGSKAAIESYADTLAIHAITRITRGTNLYVVSGPLAMGINDRIKEIPELFGEKVKDLRDLIFQGIDTRIKDDLTCNLLRKSNNFDIVCDKSMSVANNTFGGSLLLAGGSRDFAKRGEWITISTSVLKDNPSIKEKINMALVKMFRRASKAVYRMEKAPETTSKIRIPDAIKLSGYIVLGVAFGVIVSKLNVARKNLAEKRSDKKTSEKTI